jgi:hypothetical protein
MHPRLEGLHNKIESVSCSLGFYSKPAEIDFKGSSKIGLHTKIGSSSSIKMDLTLHSKIHS